VLMYYVNIILKNNISKCFGKYLAKMLSKNNSVNERVAEIIEFYDLNVNSFSKRININSSVIHNIVKGKKDGSKNKPSFMVLNKIILSFNNINADWLLTGRGRMLKNDQKTGTESLPIGEAEKLQNEIKELKTEPSFLVLKKIFSVYDDLDANWLVCGEGEMEKKECDNSKYLQSKVNQIEELQKQIESLEKDKDRLLNLLEMYAPNPPKKSEK